jgi:hypothetical protein
MSSSMPPSSYRGHLFAAPVAGVGEHHLRWLGGPGRFEFAAGGVKHWLEMPEIG